MLLYKPTEIVIGAWAATKVGGIDMPIRAIVKLVSRSMSLACIVVVVFNLEFATDLDPQPAKNFAWADGHWTIYSAYRANIQVPDAFSNVKMVKKALAAGASPRTLLGAYWAFTR